MDGSDNNDEDIGVRRQGFTALVPQSIESVKQFQISTLLPEPQFGRNFGAQVNVVSRSGGSRFHGTVYGFLTDRRLNARDFFDRSGTNMPAFFPVPRSRTDPGPVFLDGKTLQEANRSGGENPFTRSQAGFVFGGPIVPRKTHLFISYEHQAINASKESHFAVPEVSQRGLFESGATGLVQVIRVGDQLFQSPFYPTSAFGDAVFSLYPWPNNPFGPYGSNTRTEILPADAAGSVFSLKMDQQLNAFGRGHSFTGRYNFTDDNTILPVTGESLYSSLRSAVRAQNLSLFFDSALSNAASNQVRVSYGRTTLDFDDLSGGLGGQRNVTFMSENEKRFLLNAPLIYNFSTPIFGGLTTYRSYTNLKESNFSGLPEVNGTESVTHPIGQVIVSGFSPLGIDVFNFPQQRTNNTFQYADTLFYNFAENHKLTAGFDIRRIQLNSLLERNTRPQMVFSGAPNLNQLEGIPEDLFGGGTRTQSFYRGSDFAAVGAPTGFFQTLAGPNAFGTIGLRYWQIELFLSDQIRIRPNFILNVGLRYNVNTVPTEVQHRIEDSFQSREVKGFIALERQEKGRSGLEAVLNNRSKIFREDYNRVAPYLGFAWDPWGMGKTSLRAGYGIYYDQIPGAVISQSRNVFPNFLTLNLGGYRINPGDPSDNFKIGATNPSSFTAAGSLNNYDEGKGGADLSKFMIDTARRTNNASGPAFVLPASDLQSPSSQHWGITLEHEIKQSVLVSLGYVGTKGSHLLRFATPNLGPNVIPVIKKVVSAPGDLQPQFLGTTVSPGNDIEVLGTTLQTRGRPFPALGSYTSMESDATSSYNALQFQLNNRFSHGVQFTTAYTWSHALDEVSDLFDLAGARSLPQNSFDRRAERASSSFDVRHRFVTSFIWELPVFNRSKVFGGWQVAGIGTWQTGQPFTIYAPYDINLDGNLTDRLNGSAGFRQVNRSEIRFEFSDPFSQLPKVGTDGALGRNTFRAPGIAAVDLAISKRFLFAGTQALEFRAEFFNLFNRTHFGIPVKQVDFPAFGQSVNTHIPARTIQLALKYSF